MKHSTLVESIEELKKENKYTKSNIQKSSLVTGKLRSKRERGYTLSTVHDCRFIVSNFSKN